ncbi:hypothetical protein HBH70_025830 [Parastagonospora nodorum]|nr:hypothetical protein HBH53_214120 [Parastagonospora nodorum]KAH3958309.1 hypothetical protein HBH51_212280 [Parastagonospora nodorum]KAH3992135.1 hypothetical protein HBI10_222210 [Parastagonospora nodorum]KAH4009633.1 hypothetical protein HBI13_217250 [Parastagonospora nodorum]KAH4043516.1 hypothetical protein HBH49_231340 [Parastagonospora nodorum]
MAPARRALRALRDSLGNDASLLDQLPPITKLITEEQAEIPGAVPTAILFGYHKDNVLAINKPRLWIYLYRISLTLLFHSYFVDGEPGGVFMVDDALRSTDPHDAFKFATDSMRVVVLATYYFMLLDESTTHVLAMTKSQEGVLLDICKDIRKSKKPQSLVVKLSVRIPCELFRAATPHDETIIASASRTSDSGIEDMEGDGNKKAASAQPFNEDNVRSSSVRVTCNDTPRPTDHIRQPQIIKESSSAISRYNEVCNEELQIDQKLEQCRRKLEVRRERMEALEGEINQELESFDSLNEKAVSCESRKRKARDVLSPDELQQLYWRNAGRKNPGLA